jgi:histidinol-phosphate aminotransferase
MVKISPRFSLGRLEEYKVETVPDADIIVNANETNWPLAKSLVAKIKGEIDDFAFNRYPPMHAESICQTLGEGMRLNPDRIIVGNGSSELLEKACYAFGGFGKKIAFPYPSFSMYETYALLADSAPTPYPLNKEGFVDAQEVINFCAHEHPSLLIICNPNNPTGNYNPLQVMEDILKNVECPVIMDEAYMEFVDPNDKYGTLSTLSLLDTYDNFLCLRTFSKAYGLAGMRVGYGTGSDELISVMKKVLLPYHVNNLSLRIAQLAYGEPDLLRSRVSAAVRERKKLTQALVEMGFKVFPSATNFVMFQPAEEQAYKIARAAIKLGYKLEGNNEQMTGSVIFSQLLGEKILVRDFTAHPALPGAIRLTVGTEEENIRIIKALQNICEMAKEG